MQDKQIKLGSFKSLSNTLLNKKNRHDMLLPIFCKANSYLFFKTLQNFCLWNFNMEIFNNKPDTKIYIIIIQKIIPVCNESSGDYIYKLSYFQIF